MKDAYHNIKNILNSKRSYKQRKPLEVVILTV